MARIVRLIVFVTLLALIALPASSQAPDSSAADRLAGHAPDAGVRYYVSHPGQAPPERASRVQTARSLAARASSRARAAGRGAPFGDLFNRDTVGLPENEESVSSCTSRPSTVLGGTNDYRGLLDPQLNFTGWHFSTDGGRSVANEGLLPPVTINGAQIPSGGDPVDVIGGNCTPYAASLNYDPIAPIGEGASGVGLYRSTPQTLAGCPQGVSNGGMTHPECWPTRRVVDVAAPGHFLDKEWMDVGRSGAAGEVVWVAYGDLSNFNAEGNEESGVVKAVRCTANLSSCTAPIVLSAGQTVAEYPSVTIGADGRTYITWGEFFGGSFVGGAQRGWLAVAEPGSTTFTVRQAVPTDDLIMRGRGTLHANDFRTGTMFKNTVKLVNGHPRIFVVWEHCTARLDQICEEPVILLTQSSDLGRTWTAPRAITAGGDNYFPELDTDPATGTIAGTWYTNRFDRIFHNRQDVELVRLSDQGTVQRRVRVTRTSNETEADPILGGAFIGDYIEVSANHGVAYVHYNANERHVQLVNEGLPIPQQDNYLTTVRLG